MDETSATNSTNNNDDAVSSMAKKRRSGSATASSSAKRNKNGNKSASAAAMSSREAMLEEIGYSTLSLENIRSRIEALCRKVPVIPESGFELSYDKDKVDGAPSGCSDQTKAVSKAAASIGPVPEESAATTTTTTTTTTTVSTDAFCLPKTQYPCRYNLAELRSWATALQTVLEEFYLLVALVSPATYRWGAERSGAAEQNLSLLSNEFVRSQEQITTRVTTRLNDVLAPVVTLVTTKSVTYKPNEDDNISRQSKAKSPEDTSSPVDSNKHINGSISEVKQNYFVTTFEDPDYVHLAHTILARNSSLLRQIVLANFDKLLRAIADYLRAQEKDAQHDSRGFVY